MQKNNNIGNRCVIYARYSCSNQTEQSIEGQMHDCEQFAARNNLQIVNSYIDRATTATTDKRPQFLQIVNNVFLMLFLFGNWIGFQETDMTVPCTRKS